MTAMESVEQRVSRLHREAIIIDGHSDILMSVADGRLRLGDRPAIPSPVDWAPPLGWQMPPMATLYGFSAHTAYFQTLGQYDMPRMLEGGLTAQAMAVYIGDEHVEVALHRALEMVYWLRLDAAEHDAFTFITSTSDFHKVKSAGGTGGFLTFEGFEPLGNDLKLLDLFYDLGLRMATLTHSRRNVWADGTLPGLRLGGLTELGKNAIKRMTELGIVIDLAHLAYPGCEEVVAMTDVPLVLSHGSIPFMFRGGATPSGTAPGASDNDVRTLAEAIAKSGGVIGEIAFGHPTVKAMIDDIEALVSWIGIDHVGLGSDFFGMDMAPAGYTSIDQLPNVTRALVERGFSDDDVLKILGGNFLRVFEAVWH